MQPGLIHAYLLDHSGGGKELPWAEVASWQPTQGVLWLHLDYTDDGAAQWLRTESGLDRLVVEALLSEETRPRATPLEDNLLIALRGVNLDPASQPEDMVSIRLWVEENRIISTRKRRLLSVEDLLGRLRIGRGPSGPSSFIVSLVDLLVRRMGDIVDQLEEKIDELESLALDAPGGELRSELAYLRKQAITLRRYLSPQREALSGIMAAEMPWFHESNLLHLREVSDRLQRHIEDIDVVRERASVTQEELLSYNSEQLNSRMYMLSIVAAVFLPLSFLTGLFGINVGGMPWAQAQEGFLIFCVLLGAALGLQIVLFYWKKWL
ncbi:zinc transporter ZntB [uncultured Microbulbifer sp.]|uniref:zinc transporter ZntB n=1 Tax=uncultured Microbulbifer sp. TaxID=348147 RepID=UPI002622F8DE|nr:zinc transporter ZntB [uncultured Microbulbifer sp.]